MWPGSNSTYRRVLKWVQTNATHSMPPAVTLCCWQGANIQSVTGRARVSNATATMWVCSSIDWEELKRSSSLPWPEVPPHYRAYSPSEYDQTRSPTTPQGLQSKWVRSNQKSNHTTGLTVQVSTIKPEVQPHHRAYSPSDTIKPEVQPHHRAYSPSDTIKPEVQPHHRAYSPSDTIKPEVQPHHSPSEYDQMVASPISV